MNITRYALAVLGAGLGLLLLAGAARAQEEREVAIGAFSEIEAGGGLRVEISQGEAQSVRMLGDASDFDEVEVQLRGDRLMLFVDRRSWFGRTPDVDVTVQVVATRLDEIKIGRGSRVEVIDLEAGDLELDLNTGASAELTGRCDRLQVSASTGVSADASGLVCADVEVSASTGATVSVHATERVDASASTGASIRVYGDPEEYRTSSSLGGTISLRNGGGR